MEQEAPEGETNSEAKSEDPDVKTQSQDTEEHAKMPEHPGRDSDSDEEEEEQQ